MKPRTDSPLERAVSAGISAYCRMLEGLIVAALAVMVVMVFGNVVLRYAFNSGITVSEELSRWLFVWMIFLGAVVAIRDNAHLGTDLLIGRLGPRGKKVCLALAETGMLYCCWLVFAGSWAQTKINLDVQAPASSLSMAWLTAGGLVFAVSAFVLHAIKLARLATGRLGDDELVTVQESEDRLAHPEEPIASSPKKEQRP
jgi:TRAP-type C4-dicarboxylate transport system permease small subunit